MKYGKYKHQGVVSELNKHSEISEKNSVKICQEYEEKEIQTDVLSKWKDSSQPVIYKM